MYAKLCKSVLVISVKTTLLQFIREQHFGENEKLLEMKLNVTLN